MVVTQLTRRAVLRRFLLTMAATGILLLGAAGPLQAIYQPADEELSQQARVLPQDARGIPSALGRIAQEAPYAPGQLIVKYKDSVTESVHHLVKHKKSFKEATTDYSDSLDKLHKKFQVRAANPLFRTALEEASIPAPRGLAALKEHRRTKIARVQEHFSRRTGRAPEDAVLPDLTHVYLLHIPEKTDVRAAVAEFQKDPHIEYAQPNYVLQIFAPPIKKKKTTDTAFTSQDVLTLPNDTYIDPDQDGVWSSGSWGQSYEDMWGLKIIEADRAWQDAQGGGIVVAVVDTGVHGSHADLAANMWVNPDEIPANGIDDDANGFIDDLRGRDFVNNDNEPDDDHLHGTHVAGTIAAELNNSVGIAGVAPKATVLPVKVFSSKGSGSLATIFAGLEYAAMEGADVINMSFGGPTGVFGQAGTEVIRVVHGLGVVLVAAAGNSADNAQGSDPASLPEVITVAAFDQKDEITYFSNFGSKIDVAAPGGNGKDPPPDYRPVYNVLSLLSPSAGLDPSHPLIVDGAYLRLAGTSMAAPHAAGLAALILSRNPATTNEQVRHVMRISADDVGPSGWDPTAGFGRINATRALRYSSVPTAVIDSPQHESTLSGRMHVTGRFSSGNRDSSIRMWQLSYRNAEESTWQVLGTGRNPTGGTCSVSWDTSGLFFGSYVLKLEVEQSDGQIASDVRRVHRKLYHDISHLTPTSGQAAWSIDLADVDNDGDLDAFVGNVLGSPLAIFDIRGTLLINSGNGVFSDESSSRLPASGDVGGGIAGARFLDIDGDGDQDLFLTVISLMDLQQGGAFVWINNGHGVFTDESSQRLSDRTSGNKSDVLVADVDNDGDVDILVSQPMRLFINNGSGSFTQEASERARGIEPITFALDDSDRDGDSDLLYLQYVNGSYYFEVAVNDGNGYFAPKQVRYSPARELTIGDINGDGLADAVNVVYPIAFVNDGSGSFISASLFPLPELPPRSFESFLFDVDLDGDKDLLLFSDALNRPRIHYVLSNTSDRHGGAVGFVDTTDRFLFEWHSLVHAVAFRDITEDGYPDLIIGRQFERTGLLESLVSEFQSGDVDGDGKLTSKDALLVLQFAQGKKYLSSQQQLRARVALLKADITKLDSDVILDYVAGYVARLPIIFGDVDENGFINKKDVDLAMRAVVGMERLTLDQQYRADVNRDGKVTAQDALLITKYLSGEVPYLPSP